MSEEPEIIWYDNLTRPKRDAAPVSKLEKRAPMEEPEFIWYDNLTRPDAEKVATSNHSERRQIVERDPPTLA